jgi:phosphoribosylanthranilate isomerase
MIVKVCGITSSEDAQAAITAGATAIGFNFYLKSPRYITPENAAAIDTPPGVLRVGVFVNEPSGTLHAIARSAALDIVQLHGDEPPESLPRDLRVWKAFRVDPQFTPAQLDLYDVEAFLLDGPAGEEYGGKGQPFAWASAAGLRHSILIAGGLDASNVGLAIRAAHPWGVDACSRLESAPGRKDNDKVRAFVRAALLGNNSNDA